MQPSYQMQQNPNYNTTTRFNEELKRSAIHGALVSTMISGTINYQLRTDGHVTEQTALAQTARRALQGAIGASALTAAHQTVDPFKKVAYVGIGLATIYAIESFTN